MDPTTRPNMSTLVFPAAGVAWAVCFVLNHWLLGEADQIGADGAVAITGIVTWIAQRWDRASKRNHQHVIRKHGAEYYGPAGNERSPADDTA